MAGHAECIKIININGRGFQFKNGNSEFKRFRRVTFFTEIQQENIGALNTKHSFQVENYKHGDHAKVSGYFQSKFNVNCLSPSLNLFLRKNQLNLRYKNYL